MSISTASPPAPMPSRTRRFVDAVKVGYVSQAVLTVAALFLTLLLIYFFIFARIRAETGNV